MTLAAKPIQLSWLHLTISFPAGIGFASTHIIRNELGKNGGHTQLWIMKIERNKIMAVKTT
jgi:hypothetical protein